MTKKENYHRNTDPQSSWGWQKKKTILVIQIPNRVEDDKKKKTILVIQIPNRVEDDKKKENHSKNSDPQFPIYREGWQGKKIEMMPTNNDGKYFLKYFVTNLIKYFCFISISSFFLCFFINFTNELWFHYLFFS